MKEVIIDFGDYVLIEQLRYGVPNEMYLYKVVGGNIRSNSYVSVPVQCPETETLQGQVEDVISCICCGVKETNVVKFRVQDVTLVKSSLIHKINNKIRQVKDQQLLTQVYQVLCAHEQVVKKDDSAKCTECNCNLGWYCPKSPDHQCYYYSEEIAGKKFIVLNNDTKVPLPDDHNSEYETDDSCLFCGEPDERK